MWPVLQRELREQARQNGTYWLRVIAAGVVILLFWLAWERQANGGQLNGRGYFLGLHRFLFLGIWFVAPVLTADCLARERRDGTLGLLFLTPLRPVDVVVGKAFVHALRGMVFVLAAIPVMIVPILLGGVTWLDAVRLMLLQLAALGLALVSGLMASVLTESWWRARMLAFLFAVGAAALFFGLYVGIQVLPWQWRSPSPGIPETFAGQFSMLINTTLMRQGVFANRGFDGFWQDWSPIGSGWSSLRLAVWVWLAAWLLVGVAVGLAALGVRRTWRSEPLSARGEVVRRWFTEIHFAPEFWRRRRATLMTANPVRWLQSRTWSARVGGWALLGFAFAMGGAVIDVPRNLAEGLYFISNTLLLGGLAFAAVASFRQERESGALELWLVTPLPPEAVVRGRLAGLATRFFWPSVIILFLPQIQFAWSRYLFQQSIEGAGPLITVLPPVDWLLAIWLVATIVFGVGLALSRLTFLTAFALAWVAHHTPFVATALLDWAHDEMRQKFGWGLPGWSSEGFFTHFSWVLAASVSVWGTSFARRQLAERRFVAGWRRADLSAIGKVREVRAP